MNNECCGNCCYCIDDGFGDCYCTLHDRDVSLDDIACDWYEW